MVNKRAVIVDLDPSVLRWARERSRLEPDELARKIPVKADRVRTWESTGRISLAQVRKLAAKTYTPEGFLFLHTPPEDRLEIPDLRTVGDNPIRPSPDLLDTVHAMEQRQAWMRGELVNQGAEPLSFVGSASMDDPVEEVAASMRQTLALASGWAAAVPTWVETIRLIQRRIDASGVLVVSNGVVGNNTHRPLDPDEFRGFSLSDDYAPLVFVNGADFKSAQMFTLAHELAHIWLDASGVSNPDLGDLDTPRPRVEQRCNEIAAEFLVPADELRVLWNQVSDDSDRFGLIARHFKTSKIVAARCALDRDLISRAAFFRFWEDHQAEEWRGAQTVREGGNFWNTQGVRLGRRFSHAVVNAVIEGRLLYQDAYALTSLRGPTFDTLVSRVRESE
jgi:Zn-dependent peptidase ImmA (M78 family)